MKTSFILAVSWIICGIPINATEAVQDPVDAEVGYPFSEGIARVLKIISPGQNGVSSELYPGLYGYINKSGNIFVEPKYLDAGDFHEGLAAVADKGSDQLKYGFIDNSGHIAIPITFKKASRFSEGLAAVKLDATWGYIDHMGKYVIASKFVSATDFREGLALVGTDGKKSVFINQKGEEVIKSVPDLSLGFSEGLTALGSDKWVRHNGILAQGLNEHSIQSAGYFSEGLAEVILPHRNAGDHTLWGFCDHSGVLVIAGPFEGVYRFSEGLAAVKRDGKWGFVDSKGNLKVPFVHETIDDLPKPPPIIFSEGLVFIQDGYMNRNGDIEIPFRKKE